MGNSLAGRVPTIRTVVLELFGLEPSATDDDLRGAVLRRLADRSLHQDSALCAATDLIAGRQLTAALIYELQSQRADRLLAAYSESFFELAPLQRRSRYVELLAECELSSSAIRRLKALEPGLDLDVGSFADADALQKPLAETLLKMFTATPGEQVALRHRFLQDHVSAERLSKPSIERFKEQFPELAALKNGLIHETWLLAGGNAEIKTASLKRRDQIQTWARQQNRSESGGIFPGWQLIFLIFPFLSALSGLVRGCGSSMPQYDYRSSGASSSTHSPLEYSSLVREQQVRQAQSGSKQPQLVIAVDIPRDSPKAEAVETQIRQLYGDVTIQWAGEPPRSSLKPRTGNNVSKDEPSERRLSGLKDWSLSSADTLNEHLPQISHEYITHLRSGDTAASLDARRLASLVIKACRVYQRYDHQFSDDALQSIEQLQDELDGKLPQAR